MRDVTAPFVHALDSHRPLDRQEIGAAVAALMQREGGSVSWSPEASEEWFGLLTATGEDYALIWTWAPLAICMPTVSSTLREILNNREAVIIEAANWHAPDYRIDPDPIRMRGIPDYWPSEPHEMPTTGFSILDLMWETI